MCPHHSKAKDPASRIKLLTYLEDAPVFGQIFVKNNENYVFHCFDFNENKMLVSLSLEFFQISKHHIC